VSFLSYRTPPKVEDKSALDLKKEQAANGVQHIGKDWIRQNSKGIWELKLSGSPFEIGSKYGILAKEQIHIQEEIFVTEFSKAVPGKVKQFFLKHLVGWFNRKLDRNIPNEYLKEMYGVSQAYSTEFNFIAPRYMRVLNYHAAHDIGHALNDYQLVGCSSFSVKGAKTENGNLLIGRNFDLYMGDEFAKQKVISFITPNSGHPFASFSWPGFLGVVSGMNVKGLTVSLNAAKSVLPTSSKDPISVVAREILQYASTIDEAVEIAAKRKVFVSEAIMVSSAQENETALIEKSPKEMDVYRSGTDQTVCANHFQSDLFKTAESNLENIEKSDSNFRHLRMEKLLEKSQFDFNDIAQVLRDRSEGEGLGHGNPRAINQLLAHHSIIFQPADLKMWVTTAPWQLGEYICYDLNTIFATDQLPETDLHQKEFSIPSDSFLDSDEYDQFLVFKKHKKAINDFLNYSEPLEMTPDKIDEFIQSNSEYYETYMMLGLFFKKAKQRENAKKYFQMALEKTVASIEEEEKILALIKKCK
jgi:isopenicillin-N N-acyltransferase-like protein